MQQTASTSEPVNERRIAHLDMDAFYASVELLERPDLKDKPVAIGGRGNPDSRGVVTTATYEARSFGIHSGMSLRRAAQLCPECVFLPTDFPRYRRYSRLFKEAVRELAPIIEDRGIDEIFIDLSKIPGVVEDRGRLMAARLQASVSEATQGLTCSIGVAPNKLLAKLASEFNKPRGLTVLEMHELETIVWPLPVKKINGIGPRASEKLNRLRIQTIGDLAAIPAYQLTRQFGRSYGAWLHEVAWGRDDRPVVTHSEPVSRSKETTFEADLHLCDDRNELLEIVQDLCEQLATDLQAREYTGATIGIKLRFSDFTTTTRDLSIAKGTNDSQQIMQAARQCLRRIPETRSIRLIGVRVSGLSRISEAAPDTPDLFGFDRT